MFILWELLGLPVQISQIKEFSSAVLCMESVSMWAH